jgi:hypothetical protein
MRKHCSIWLMTLSTLASGQTAAPSFRADRVLYGGSDRVKPLAPGMDFSIYGQDLGPEESCAAQAPYPTELCGVQVFLANKPMLLLYVHARQINFMVPEGAPLEGTAELRVQAQTLSSAVTVRVGVEKPKLSLEGIARVDGPVWVRVELPYPLGTVVYPVSNRPNDFGCNTFEVRRNGVALPRIPFIDRGTHIGGGNICGNDTAKLKNPIPRHAGRIPLHLQYRFEEPGLYELRYTRIETYVPWGPVESDWTTIQVQPAQPEPPLTPPQDPYEILSDFLPNLLAVRDVSTWGIVAGYLEDPNEEVRRYAAASLGYWH